MSPPPQPLIYHKYKVKRIYNNPLNIECLFWKDILSAKIRIKFNLIFLSHSTFWMCKIIMALILYSVFIITTFCQHLRHTHHSPPLMNKIAMQLFNSCLGIGSCYFLTTTQQPARVSQSFEVLGMCLKCFKSQNSSYQRILLFKRKKSYFPAQNMTIDTLDSRKLTFELLR